MDHNLLHTLAALLTQGPDSGLDLNTNKNHLLKIHGEMADSIASVKLKKGQAKLNISVCKNKEPVPNVNVKLDPSSRVDIVCLMRNQDNVLVRKFFLCRTIAPVFQMSAIVSVVDDPIGEKAVQLALYKYPTKFRPLEEVLPVGTILAIKNPWFKSTLDGGYALRVDDPKNVIVLDDSSMEKIFPKLAWKCEIPEKYRHLAPKPKNSIPIVNKALECKITGNSFFAKKKYSQALNCYTEGLKLEPNNIELLANRSAAYLNLVYFHRALEDAEKVVSMDSSHVKGNYRKVKSLWGLKRYDDAISRLKNITSKHGKMNSNVDFLELLSKYENLVLLRSSGNYDWAKFFENRMKQEVDFVDYRGPIKIHPNIFGKGRGIVATEDISPGTLLIASKAFSMFYLDLDRLDESSNLFSELELNLDDELAKIVAQKLTAEPEFRKEIYELFAGPDMPPLSEKMIRGSIDKTRLKNICAINLFKGNTNWDVECYKKAGLWILPSYINHSCWDSNCTWIVVGDVMIIRSYKNISKGEEILISYFNPLQVYEERMKEMTGPGKFICQCTLCQEDLRDSKNTHKRRKRILRYIESNLVNETTIFKLEALRRYAPTLNNVVVPPLMLLAWRYFGDKDLYAAIAAMSKGYNILKNTSLVDEPLEYVLNIIFAFMTLGLVGEEVKKEVQKWVSILKLESLIRYGSVGVIKGHVGKQTFISGHEYLESMEAYGLSFD